MVQFDMLDMCPSFSIHYLEDRRNSDVELFGNFGLSHFGNGIKFSDFSNLILGKFTHSGKLSTHGFVAPLLKHILSVLLASSKEKMFRIAADWSVTLMTNLKTLWDRAVINLPRISMSSYILIAVRRFVSEMSVAISILGASPKPASVFSHRVQLGKKFYWNHVVNYYHKLNRSQP